MLGISRLQTFFPPLECLFKTESHDRFHELGIKFSENVVDIGDKLKLSDGSEIDFHTKITMLVSPFKWMKGDFGSIGLPTHSEAAKKIHSKMQNHNNAAYVGCILSVVLSHCKHFPKVYGAFTGNAKNHTINISDDYEEICEESWFSQNIGKTFDLKLNEEVGNAIQYSRKARTSLDLGEEIDLEVESIDAVASDAKPAGVTEIYTNDEYECDTESSGVSTSYFFEIESMPTSFDGSVCSDESEDEPFAWATFHDVPVQMTVMEKLGGTLYDLMKLHTETDKHFAWISQVIFALAYAQRTFGFVHNDLHGNNIMFKNTEEDYLYYMHDGKTYKVPTFGYLIKIIDFDRGIGSIKLAGMKESKFFMSDQFDIEEEAGGQYNYEPFYTNKVPTIKPNPSFDLVRLATSLFWDIFPEGPHHDEYQNQKLFRLFMKWLKLEDGSSVLFFKNNPKVDRYNGFSLYKAIARFSNSAVPRKEISELSCFLGDCPVGETPLVIEV